MQTRSDNLPTAPSSRALDGAGLAEAMAEAAVACARNGFVLRGAREEVLRLLIQTGRPLKAYDLVAAMMTAGRFTKPPVVYRALRSLEACGLIHRIETLAAYVAGLKGSGASALFICRQCGDVVESSFDAGTGLRADATARGFRIDRWSLEILGDCNRCGGAAGRQSAAP